MKFWKLIFVTIIFVLCACYSYTHVDLQTLITIEAWTQQVSLEAHHHGNQLIHASLVVQTLLMFPIWIFLTSSSLLILFCRSKNLTQFMLKPASQFWLGLLFSMMICMLIKVTIGRYRPEMYLMHHLYGFSGFSLQHLKNSMPSDHTALAFSMAATLSYFCRNRFFTGLFYMLALGVAVTRIIVMQHYLSDVFMGALVGLWGSYCAYYLCHLFRKKNK